MLKLTPKKFVLDSIDKTSNNVAIIYKQYYFEVVINETDVTGHGNYTFNERLIKVVMRK